MAASSTLFSLAPPSNSLANRVAAPKLPPTAIFRSISPVHQFRTPKIHSTSSASSSSAATADDQKAIEEIISIDALQRFIELNLGKWTGSFHQFDAQGNLMHKISTKLAVGSYGEDELVSLIQTLYIKQPPSSTAISGDNYETEWAEYKIKETNMFTVDKYQQFADWIFPKREGICFKVSDGWYVGNNPKTRGAGRG